MIVLRQKEYGLKDSYNGWVDKKIAKHEKKRSESMDKLYDNFKNRPKKIENQELKKKLIDSASKHSVVSDDEKYSYAVTDRKNIKDSARMGNKLAEKAMKENKSIVATSKESGPEEIAHEMGHVKNYHSLNPVTRVRHRYGKAIAKKCDRSTFLGATGLKQSVINGEEKSASKKGLKILKKHGASKEELEQAKTNYGYAYNSYKHGGNVEKERSRANLYRKIKLKLH